MKKIFIVVLLTTLLLTGCLTEDIPVESTFSTILNETTIPDPTYESLHFTPIPYIVYDYATLIEDWKYAQTADPALLDYTLNYLVYKGTDAETPYILIPESQNTDYELYVIYVSNSEYCFQFVPVGYVSDSAFDINNTIFVSINNKPPYLYKDHGAHEYSDEDLFNFHSEGRWCLNIDGRHVYIELPDSLTVEDSSVLREWFKFTFYTLDGEPSETAPA